MLEGTIIGRCMQRHRHLEFIRFLNAIEAEVIRDGIPYVTPLVRAPLGGSPVISVSLPALLGYKRRALLLHTIVPRKN